MIDTTQLTQLISAFRVETEKESISPETVGALLQKITDLLAGASTDSEQKIFENWKNILSQLRLVESVDQGVSNIEHVNINLTLRDLANGGRSGATFSISPATAQRAGVMTAAQAQMLASLNIAVSALQLAAVNLANKNTEQDNRLDIIQARNDVITAIAQGSPHLSKVFFNIRKENLKTGEIYNKSNNKEIAAATNEQAGVMTAQQVKDLQKAVNGLLIQDELIRVLHSIDLVVTSVEERPARKDCVYLGIEFCELYAGERFPADDDVMIPGATEQQAGVMTAKQVADMNRMQRDINGLKKSIGTDNSPMFHIEVVVEDAQLRVKGANELIEAGYYPVLLRHSKKRNDNKHDERHGHVTKGWNRVGQSTDVLRFNNDDVVSIGRKELKHAEVEEELLTGYGSDAEWFVNDREKKGKRYTSLGKSKVLIATTTQDGKMKARKVRLLYGIAFTKQKTGPRRKPDLTQLVTNIATFHVATSLGDKAMSYYWIFER